jgi:hypothetical protein
MRTKTWRRCRSVSRSSVGWRRRGGVNLLASAPLWSVLGVRVCGDAVGTANVGSHAPACLTFYFGAAWEGATAIHGRRPRSGRVSDWETDPKIRPEITFLTFCWQTGKGFWKVEEEIWLARQTSMLYLVALPPTILLTNWQGFLKGWRRNLAGGSRLKWT